MAFRQTWLLHCFLILKERSTRKCEGDYFPMNLKRRLFIFPYVLIVHQSCAFISGACTVAPTPTATDHLLGDQQVLLHSVRGQRAGLACVSLCTHVIRSYSRHHQRRERQETHNRPITAHLSTHLLHVNLTAVNM